MERSSCGLQSPYDKLQSLNSPRRQTTTPGRFADNIQVDSSLRDSEGGDESSFRDYGRQEISDQPFRPRFHAQISKYLYLPKPEGKGIRITRNTQTRIYYERLRRI